MWAWLVTAGRYLFTQVVLPIGAFMGFSWAMTPKDDPTMIYVLYGMMALMTIGIGLLVWSVYV